MKKKLWKKVVEAKFVNIGGDFWQAWSDQDKKLGETLMSMLFKANDKAEKDPELMIRITVEMVPKKTGNES